MLLTLKVLFKIVPDDILKYIYIFFFIIIISVRKILLDSIHVSRMKKCMKLNSSGTLLY